MVVLKRFELMTCYNIYFKYATKSRNNHYNITLYILNVDLINRNYMSLCDLTLVLLKPVSFKEHSQVFIYQNYCKKYP